MHNWNTRKEKKRKVQQQHCHTIDPVLSNINDRYQATDPGCSLNIKNKYQKTTITVRLHLDIYSSYRKPNTKEILKKKLEGKKS